MSKKLLFTILIIALTFHCKGQSYDSLLKPGKRWYYKLYSSGDNLTYNGGNISILNETRKYNGKNYFKLKAKITLWPQFDSIWVREEEKRIYFINLEDTVNHGQELIMYDFNLAKGDTFKFKMKTYESKDSFLNGRLIVDTTFMKDNRKHIKFIYHTKIFENNSKYVNLINEWVEGIGANQVLFYTYDSYVFVPSEYSRTISCLMDNQYQILPKNGICDSLLDIPKLINVTLRVSPNPATKQYTVQLKNSEKCLLHVYNSMGYKVDEFELQGKLIYMLPCDYNRGIYFLRVIHEPFSYIAKLIVE